MSKVFNNEGIKAGCIYRIALENFVTYKQVVLYPSQSLNLIIGPNGTGKSTFVCAIILGLCGKTSVIGRAKKISEYVRSGCEESTIEIELYRNSGERNVIITRNFNLRDVSTWAIDHKTVREKQVLELIASLNIQVDNLCQLLPQDRVQDFSKMNPQELLRSTLSAVGGQESVSQLDELIECRNKHRGLSTKVQNNAQLLQEQIRLNERLKTVIDGMHQRKEIEKQIEICEKKKLWLEYQTLREQVIECERDKKEAVKLVNTHKSKMEPLEKVIDKAKVGISKLEQEKLSANREINSLKDSIKEAISSARQQEYTLKDLEAALQEKIERHQNKERELLEANAKLEKLRNDKKMLIEKIGDENVDAKRLEVLRAYSEDCYKAVMWLRENKHMFSRPVYEPIMLEINFTDAKFARYLEATVPARDLAAFTFESSADMNLFLQKVRRERGLKLVNAICSSNPATTHRPDITQLSYLGFYTYLIDTINGPEPIINYLCRQYGIHRIPIGNDHTYKNSAKVPSNITHFFTENHRFSVRVSAYSGVKSSSIIEIRPARLLANTVDVDQIHSLNNQLAVARDSVRAQEKNLIAVKLDYNRNSIVHEESKLRELKNDMTNVQATLENIENQLIRVKTKAKEKLNEAKRSCNNKLPNDPDFPHTEDFAVLPSEINELMTHCFELQARVNCMDEGDERAIKEYEEREQMIAKLKNDVESSGDVSKQLEIKMNRIKSKWLPPLEALLRDIDKTFGDMFEKLGCAGEIKLDKAGADEDYDKYGVSILVRFRSSEQLAQLTRHAQSGGERALTTAIYLMALQRRTTVPFRCVDEINQGMDAINERKMFQLLVQVTTECDNAQYFLLTPKLLTNLEYNSKITAYKGLLYMNEKLCGNWSFESDFNIRLKFEILLTNLEYNSKITVHTIMNGPRVMHHSKWKCQQFIDNARKYMSTHDLDGGIPRMQLEAMCERFRSAAVEQQAAMCRLSQR
ncbi:Structural maintenance of chromosomes protein 5 [Papilio machaon]|uniref:Structural maintenance of chromosomes protein 5 n=1 Tax=Papilio machaon TaxID=76193 RepID=A0A0N0PE10_PAPMA|nr:Structural maintenance of chromosomes protein 5 [Papilio machaon]